MSTSSMHVIHVGATQGDLRQMSGAAIQVAIDALATRGGGRVVVEPGTYLMQGPLRMRSRVSLQGTPGETILKRGPLVWSHLAEDADIGQKQVRPVDASGFEAGMGVLLGDDDQRFPQASMPLTITEVKDGVLHTHDYNIRDICAEKGGMVATYYPLIHAMEQEDFVVEGMVLDSHVEDAGPLAGIWGRGLYLRRCHRVEIRHVESRHVLGDGLGCGQGGHITFEECTAAHNTHYGIHPGSHSPHTRIAGCHVHDNGSDGVYLCWGVAHSEVVDCDVHDNGTRLYRNGICTGHKDTDNLIARNRVYRNAKHGIHIRDKTEANGAHRTAIVGNVIEDNGWPFEAVPESLKQLPRQELLGHGIYVCGITRDVTIDGNTIRETRTGADRHQRHALYVAPNVTGLTMRDNVVEGHPDDAIVDDARDASNQFQKIDTGTE